MDPMPTPEVRLALPQRWHLRRSTADDVVTAARSPVVPPSGIRPEVVLRCVPVDLDLDLGEWRRAALADLAGRLEGFALEDEDAFGIGPYDVRYARFAHRLGAADVIVEQWAWAVDGVGVTLTCSVAREDYEDYCDVFEGVAGSVEIVPAAA